MATFTNLSVTDSYDALLSTTLRKYKPKLEDQIFHALPLLYWLNEKGRRTTQNGGYEIMVPLLYGENTTVQNYDKYDILNTTPQEGITTARYQWKQLAGSVAISRKEERQNSGEYQLINLLKAKIMQLEESMKWYLNDQLHGRFGSNAKTYCEASNTVDHNGGAALVTGGNEFTSLDHIVRSYLGLITTHYVGGISCDADASLNAWWANYAIPGFQRLKRNGNIGDVTSTAAAGENEYAGYITGNSNQNLISVMRTMYNRISDGNEHPDLGLTSQEVFEVYEAALMPLERFMDTKVGDAGFQNLRFKNMTLMFDHGITITVPTETGASVAAMELGVPLYMLNSKYLAWTVDSETDFMTTPFYRPENQDAKVAQVLLMANLVCSNRSKQGLISCYNEAAAWGS